MRASRSRGKRVASSADDRSERGRARKNRVKWTEKIVTKHTRIEIERRKKKKKSGRKGGQLTFDSKVFQRSARRRPLPTWITYLFHFASTTWSSTRKPQRSWTPPQGKTFGLRTSRVKNLSALKLIRQRARSLARSQVRFECL